MCCTTFAALYLTLGLGVIDETRWLHHTGGNHIGKVMVTQELVTCSRTTFQISAEHWSSVDNSKDAGANAALVEVKVKIF